MPCKHGTPSHMGCANCISEAIEKVANTRPVYWRSAPPEKCDICFKPLTWGFVDAATRRGPWGCLCHSCHAQHGFGYGTGRGQAYEKQPDGLWLKVEG